MKLTRLVCLFIGTVVLFALFPTLGVLADPSPMPSGVPVMPIVSSVNHWSQLVNAFVQGSLIMSVGAALEFLLRLIPSQKPLSIAYALEDMLLALSSLFKALGDALDKILPNRLKGGS